MQFAVAIIFVSYILFVVWLLLGWRRSMRKRPTQVETPLLSVVVPARNEENVVLDLLYDLKKQSYQAFEVLVVNDHSEDRTASLVSQFIAQNPSLRIRLLESEPPGKKAAITTALQQALGEWIVTTDADCRLPVNWLSAIARQATPRVTMIVGPVRISASNLFGRLQQMEFASLIGSGAATLGWNLPTMANAANLAYRKKVFEDVGGYAGNEHIASGDDEFLMQKVHHRFPNTVFFNADPLSTVETKAQPSLIDFLHQRIRWASKWKQRQDSRTQVIAVFVFISQLIFLALPWLVLTGWLSVATGLTLWLAKASVEFLFFRPVLRFLGIPFSAVAFFALQFLYPYYVIGVGALSVVGRYQWKERYHNE
jgi:poly-beta-1,6-N-acetyl-D-glucosamine synthase